MFCIMWICERKCMLCTVMNSFVSACTGSQVAVLMRVVVYIFMFLVRCV